MSTRIRPVLALLLAALLVLPGAVAAWQLPLTSDTFDQKNPAISGTKVVWQDNRNGNWDIYLYDGMTGQTRQLTDDPKDQKYPQIAGRYVVWEDYRNSELQNNNPDIYLLDLDTGDEMMVNAPDSLWGGYELRPAIDDTDGVVVVTWFESANGLSECGRTFFRYIDGTSGPEQAYQNSITQTGPWVSGQKVVWTDIDLGGVYFRYLLGTNTVVMEQVSNDTIKGLRISGDRIVWSQYRPEDMVESIRLFKINPDLATGTGSWLSPAESFQTQPAIDGDLVVWCDDRNGDDLYIYDLATKQERPLVVGNGVPGRPAIDGELVAFIDNRDGDNEVYLVSATNSTPLPGMVTVQGGAGAPGDLNGDGRCEDVNGNGRKDFADVVLFFNQMSWIAANEPVWRFDYNTNGRIDFSDVVWLFNHL